MPEPSNTLPMRFSPSGMALSIVPFRSSARSGRKISAISAVLASHVERSVRSRSAVAM
jgi:hypothetical protein